MKEKDVDKWLTEVLPTHKGLTSSAVTIIKGLLSAEGVDCLVVSGRTKRRTSINEKIKRKRYKDPKSQLTDLSGVRVVLYFERDVEKVCQVIEKTFDIDRDNSLDKKVLLKKDQFGYRSVHYVCKLGKSRSVLPEFKAYKDIKFEIQVRTILQHAWAELAHDRNYKFLGTLPDHIERKLYLYAGMLEIADQGFDELSKQIDIHKESSKKERESGNLNIGIDSITIDDFMDAWANQSGFGLIGKSDEDISNHAITELRQFGINKIADLEKIIPKGFAESAAKQGYTSTIPGVLRDWMIINDYEKYRDECWEEKWTGIGDAISVYKDLLGPEKTAELVEIFGEDYDGE